MKDNLDTLFAGLQQKDKRSAARLMTLVENENPIGGEALERLYRLEGKSLVVGVTGWPGVGKSSLINRLAKGFLDAGKTVAIVAVDPTSAFSGGSLLGDRIRFKEIEGRDGLFIRSLATRGHHGGLSRAARAFVKVMEVTGYEVVLLETVGIGQDQISVTLVADTTIVVVAPGLGDYLQALKSGILEAGDIFVVNKGDRDDADRTILDLQNAIRMRQKDGWCPVVVKTVATEAIGVDELMAEIFRHATYCASDTDVGGRKTRAASSEIREEIKAMLLDRFFGRGGLEDRFIGGYARAICERKSDPYIVAREILKDTTDEGRPLR